MSVPPQPLSSASRNHALPFDQQQLAAAQIKIAANVAASALRPRGKSSAEGAGSHRLSFVAAPHQSMTMPPQVADDGELSEIEWINMLNPKISTRNGGYPFYAGVAFKEFLIHLMLPLSLPAIYTWIWAREGKAFADIWSQNHNFAMPPLIRPLFTRNNIHMNMMSLAGYFFYAVFIRIVAILPMIVAFLRVYDLPINGAATVSQDYTHEAYFVFVLRAAWCAVVGIKYGFYSDPLLNYMQKNHLSIALLSSEQIMNNWYPDLGRLMFELDVVTARMPLFRDFCLSVSKKHPVVKYLQRCLQVGDQPLCLLKQKSISKILQKLPENNFHKLFWTKTPSMIQRPGFVDTAAATMEIISYSKYVQGVDLSAKDFKTECAGDFEQSVGSLPSNAASQPLNTLAHLDPSLVANSVALVNGLSVENSELSGSKPEPKSDACSSKFVDVPAFILLAYCISLANNMGSAWIGPSVGECRLSYVIYFITAGFYAIAGSLRVSQLAICDPSRSFGSCQKICGTYQCTVNPEYVGQQWGDITLHICWFSGLFFWLPIICRFMCCNIFELMRRAKLVETWADILRHGRDRSLSTGIRLTSKKAIMNWYRCREVIIKYRSKIKVRLDAVAILLFLLPLGILAALMGGLFSEKGVTPKFFVMTLYLAFLFIVAIIVSVYFGSLNNSCQQQELIMLSRLIAYAETLVASKAKHNPGINLNAIEEICDGLNTVQTTLETFHTILPEKIFFWLRADWAIIWTFGVGLFTVGTVIYRQSLTDGGCRLVDGVLDYVKNTHNITCTSRS